MCTLQQPSLVVKNGKFFVSEKKSLVGLPPGNILLEGSLSILSLSIVGRTASGTEAIYGHKRNRPNPNEATNIGFFVMVIHIGIDKKIISNSAHMNY